jgi:hypothetical protein
MWSFPQHFPHGGSIQHPCQIPGDPKDGSIMRGLSVATHPKFSLRPIPSSTHVHKQANVDLGILAGDMASRSTASVERHGGNLPDSYIFRVHHAQCLVALATWQLQTSSALCGQAAPTRLQHGDHQRRDGQAHGPSHPVVQGPWPEKAVCSSADRPALFGDQRI